MFQIATAPLTVTALTTCLCCWSKTQHKLHFFQWMETFHKVINIFWDYYIHFLGWCEVFSCSWMCRKGAWFNLKQPFSFSKALYNMLQKTFTKRRLSKDKIVQASPIFSAVKKHLKFLQIHLQSAFKNCWRVQNPISGFF